MGFADTAVGTTYSTVCRCHISYSLHLILVKIALSI